MLAPRFLGNDARSYERTVLIRNLAASVLLATTLSFPLSLFAKAEEMPMTPTEVLGLAPTFEELDSIYQFEGNGFRAAVIDENGNGRVDHCEDLFAFDHKADGSIDRVVDWMDLDGDGVAERQCLFYLTGAALGPGLTGFVIDQSGQEPGGRGFWATLGGQYIQRDSQFRSDFHGSSWFSTIRWDETRQVWTPFDERPFLFFDPDNDGLTEETLRIAGTSKHVQSVRWSFDTDDDAPGPTRGLEEPPNAKLSTSPRFDDFGQDGFWDYSHAYDFDLSITATLRSPIQRAVLDTVFLREGRELVLHGAEKALPWVKQAKFKRVLLAFDEDDRNINPRDRHKRDRWEGVIAKSPNQGFPQVGNPHCGLLNKRYEIRNGDLAPIELYFSEVDGRVHLRGAEKGWIAIDHDGDGRIDDRLSMEDTDSDGYFDTWHWDAGDDGDVEYSYVQVPDDRVGTRAVPVSRGLAGLREVESRVFAATGQPQGERFWAEAKRWKSSGRFTPVEWPED